MKKIIISLIVLAGLATTQAATLDLDITDWNNQNYDLSENQYNVINVFGNGNVNFDVFYAADTGTQLNISDGATVHINEIVVSGGPVGFDLNGGIFDLAENPTLTIVLEQADLTKEGELYFPVLYLDVSQFGDDWMASVGFMNAMAASSFSFITPDGSAYEYMTGVDLEMDLMSDLIVNIPEGCALYSVKATNTKVLPEPTTATLSLLALAGLAARRRRK